MQRRLLLRSRLVQAIREVHHENGFVEVETPNLIKSTPEGARDFIVPSRLQPGTVYALPQSPQQLKQLLMVAGIDRYFQIARCFRDEDLRGDRQPEFTQLDLEMSFVDEGAVMAFIEHMVIEVSRATTPDRPIRSIPFPVFEYDEAMERYGSDKPDIRFGMELVDLAPALGEASGFRVFDETLANGGRVKGITAPGMGGATRREIDELTETAKRFGAKGLVHLSVQAGGELHGPIAKFLAAGDAGRDPGACGRQRRRPHPHRRRRGRRSPTTCSAGCAWSWAAASVSRTRTSSRTAGSTASRCTSGTPSTRAGTRPTTRSAASSPRTRCCSRRRRATSTSGHPGDPAGRARAMQYDVALNGWELGGGSVRIWDPDLLARSFNLQGYTLEQMHERFGAMLEAFEYGAPPHGGIALGVDRWAALLSDQTNIREVMAFPKTQSGSDLMLEAPSAPDEEQYEELGLRFVGVPEKR